MEIVFLALAIVGIVISVAAHPSRPFERIAMQVRVATATRRARRLGVPDALRRVRDLRDGWPVRYLDDAMICEWNHHVGVGADGSVDVDVECVVVNTSPLAIAEFRFPLYLTLDSGEQFPSVPIWAQFGTVRLDLEPAEWSPDDDVGVVRIPL